MGHEELMLYHACAELNARVITAIIIFHFTRCTRMHAQCKVERPHNVLICGNWGAMFTHQQDWIRKFTANLIISWQIRIVKSYIPREILVTGCLK